MTSACVDPESFVRGDPFFFFLKFMGDRGSKYRLNGAISSPPANAIEMVFRWRVDVGPTLNAGLVAMGFFRGS